MSTRVSTPYTVFNDTDGTPLDAGFIFIGEAGRDPETAPMPIFYDASLEIPAEQPIRTRNGYISKNGNLREIFTFQPICSIVVKNKRGVVVWSNSRLNLNPNVNTDSVVDHATGLTQTQINSTILQKSNNLSDLENSEEARKNLGVLSIEEVGEKIKDADEETKGIARIATKEEVEGGVEEKTIVTPKQLHDLLYSRVFGLEQKYEDLTEKRELDKTYTNSTGKPITVFAEIRNEDDAISVVNGEFTIDTVKIPFSGGGFNTAGAWKTAHISLIIPDKSTYKLTSDNGELKTWIEYRSADVEQTEDE